MRHASLSQPAGLNFGALGIVLGLTLAELLIISLLYQHGFVFTCREAAPVWFCAFAGRIVPRVLGVLAGLTLFALARRAALSALLAVPGPLRLGLGINLTGFLLVLLPWFGLSDASPSALVAAAALSWSLGGLCAAIGLALILAPVSAWSRLLGSHGLTLTILLVVGLGLPELSDRLQPLWRIEAVTEVTFAAVLWALELLGYVVYSDPPSKSIGTAEFAVAVGPQCSGVEGFMLITVFLSLYIGLFRRDLRFPHVLILYPVGLALSWGFNVLRITVLLMIGLEGQGELAIGAFHSHAGWLAFTVLSVLLILAARSVPWLMRDELRVRPALSLPPFLSDPAVVRILPFIVFMASALLASTGSQAPGELYPWRALAMGAVLALLWPSLRALPWRVDPWALVAGIAIAGMWIAVAPAAGDAPYGALSGAALTFWLILRILGTTLFVPIIEELFFRDYLISRLSPSRSGWSMLLAVAISTAAFAALHDRWLVAAIAGLIFAAQIWRSRNVTDAILSHGVANGLIALYALTTGAWHIL